MRITLIEEPQNNRLTADSDAHAAVVGPVGRVGDDRRGPRRRGSSVTSSRRCQPGFSIGADRVQPGDVVSAAGGGVAELIGFHEGMLRFRGRQRTDERFSGQLVDDGLIGGEEQLSIGRVVSCNQSIVTFGRTGIANIDQSRCPRALPDFG